MSLIDLPTAKLHLRVDVDDEDALIELYIGAAETAASDFLNRNVYATQADLDAADEPEEAMPMVINPAVRAAMDIGDSMIRLSVGLEDPQDLLADFEQALAGA